MDLLVPGDVVALHVVHFAVPVPGTRVDDILEGGHLGLGEDGEEVVHDVEGVGALEEAVRAGEGGGVADVGEGGGVVDEAEVCQSVGGEVVACGRFV